MRRLVCKLLILLVGEFQLRHFRLGPNFAWHSMGCRFAWSCLFYSFFLVYASDFQGAGMKNFVKVLFVAAVVLATPRFALGQEEVVPAQCANIINLSKVIYKGCAASLHLIGDPRVQGLALIWKGVDNGKGGASNVNPDKCLPVYSSVTGNVIGRLQKYSKNLAYPKGPYTRRFYSNYGCGKGDTMKKVRQRSLNRAIYIRLKASTGTCIRIAKSFSNINSSQKC